MQINPILALELRARWRSNRSFLLLLGVALALSLVAGFIYQRAVISTSSASFDPLTGAVVPALGSGQASAVGRQLLSRWVTSTFWCGCSSPPQQQPRASRANANADYWKVCNSRA